MEHKGGEGGGGSQCKWELLGQRWDLSSLLHKRWMLDLVWMRIVFSSRSNISNRTGEGWSYHGKRRLIARCQIIVQHQCTWVPHWSSWRLKINIYLCSPWKAKKKTFVQVKPFWVLPVGRRCMVNPLKGGSSLQVLNSPRCQNSFSRFFLKNSQGGVCQFEDEVSQGRGGYFGWMGFGGYFHRHHHTMIKP